MRLNTIHMVTEADNSLEGHGQGKAPASIKAPGTLARPALQLCLFRGHCVESFLVCNPNAG